MLDFVGQGGKAITLAATIALQFLLYVAIWARGVRRLPGAAPWSARLPIASIQVAFALFVIAAAIFDLAAVSSVFDAGDWANFLWQTLAFSALFVVLAHGLDLLALGPVRNSATAPAPPGTATDAPAASGDPTPAADSDPAPAATDPLAPAPALHEPPAAAGWLRRRESRCGFLAFSGGLGIFVASAVFVGRTVARTTETGVRRTFAGMIPPPVSPNDDFYTVSKNFFDPRVDGEIWRLEVDGLVDEPRRFTLDAIRAFPAEESMNTLMCISDELGDELISNARWVGASLQTVLDTVGVRPEATHIWFTSADDDTESHSLLYVRDPRVRLVWEMNGEPLPHKRGFPVRLLAPGRYGVKNPKWITRLTLIDDNIQGYWQQRGWSQEGVINTMSRIDVPPRGGRTVPGRTRVQGIAFAGARGVTGAEVSTDDGATWAAAELEPEFAPLAWRFWTFDADLREHIIRARATDGAGDVQTAEMCPTLPNGATGYHRRVLRKPRDAERPRDGARPAANLPAAKEPPHGPALPLHRLRPCLPRQRRQPGHPQPHPLHASRP